jgi:mannose-1-phosphate guanylyltransferase
VGGVCDPLSTLVVTAADQADQVARELPALPGANILAEPAARNTAAACGLAAVVARHRDADAVLAALPADHHIADEAGFARVAGRAFDLAAHEDVIVTIGIRPTRPETGFGYLELGPAFAEGARRVARFVEKPDAATARQYVDGGNHLWNAGMFFVRADRLLADIRRFLPRTADALDAIAAALAGGGEDAAARAAAEVYPELESISIDHGVMERATDVVTVPGDFGWNDVGSWTALADYRPTDADGNVTVGTVVTTDAHGNVVVGDEGCAVAVVGVDDLVVVKSGDGILVIPRRRAQDVRRVVDLLARRGLDDFL